MSTQRSRSTCTLVVLVGGGYELGYEGGKGVDRALSGL